LLTAQLKPQSAGASFNIIASSRCIWLKNAARNPIFHKALGSLAEFGGCSHIFLVQANDGCTNP
jgi:hypothetical protein